MTNDTDAAEALLEEAKSGPRSRTQTEPKQSDTGVHSLEKEIATAYADIDAGDVPGSLSMRDRNLAALFKGLEKAGELEGLGEKAATELGRDATADSRTDVLRLLLRYAIDDLDDGLLESGKEGLKRYETAKAEAVDEDDF